MLHAARNKTQREASTPSEIDIIWNRSVSS